MELFYFGNYFICFLWSRPISFADHCLCLNCSSDFGLQVSIAGVPFACPPPYVDVGSTEHFAGVLDLCLVSCNVLEDGFQRTFSRQLSQLASQSLIFKKIVSVLQPELYYEFGFVPKYFNLCALTEEPRTF